MQAHEALARREHAHWTHASRRGESSGAEAAQRRLSAHLRALPATERAALREQLVAETPSETPGHHGQIVGRRALVRTVEAHLDGGARLLTLRGPAGAGKTRAALEISARSTLSATFVDMTEARGAERMVQLLATALEVPLAGRDFENAIESALSSRGPYLLVVDNLEQVAAAAAELVDRLLTEAPELRVICTSRCALGTTGEQVVDVPPMSGLEAAELFVERGRRHMPALALQPPQRDTIWALVASLEGIPLAVELAAARLGQLSLSELQQRLADPLALLRAGLRSPRPLALKHALQWSWDLLDGPAKATLAQISVFRGGFDLQAAESVVDLRTWPSAPSVLDLLESLCADSLLQRQRSTRGTTRYRPLVAVREFAERHLTSDARSLALHRHTAHYSQYGTVDCLENLDTAAGVETWNTMVLELDNLQTAIDSALAAGSPDRAILPALAAATVYLRQGPLAAGEALLAPVLASTDVHGSPQAESLWLRVGALERVVGKVDRAAGRFEQILAARRRSGDRRGEAAALHQLGHLRAKQNRLDEAMAHFEAALEIHRETGDLKQEGIALEHTGQIAADRGPPERALRDCTRALAIHREVGNQVGESSVLRLLGLLHDQRGQRDLAISELEKSLAIDRARHNKLREGTGLATLAHIAFRAGQLSEARDLYHRALRLHRLGGDRHNECNTLINLVELDNDDGNHEGAFARCRTVLKLARELSYPAAQISALSQLASTHEAKGETTEALEHYASAVAVAEKLGSLYALSMSLADLGHLEQGLGHYQAATEHYGRALAASQEVGNQRRTATVLARTGDLCLERGEVADARVHLQRALAMHRDADNGLAEGMVLGQLGRVHWATGDVTTAEAHYRRAIEICEDELQVVAGVLRADLAVLEADRGDMESARQLLAEAEPLVRGRDAMQLALMLCKKARVESHAISGASARAAWTEARDLARLMKVAPESKLARDVAELRVYVDDIDGGPA